MSVQLPVSVLSTVQSVLFHIADEKLAEYSRFANSEVGYKEQKFKTNVSKKISFWKARKAN